VIKNEADITFLTKYLAVKKIVSTFVDIFSSISKFQIKMRRIVLFKAMLLLCALIVGSSSGRATTYKLTKVTSVSAGNKYVFERDSRVLIGSISSGALQTTGTYSSTGLSATESYVWSLESATGGFYLKNASLASNPYLNNSSSTDMGFGSKSSIWTIEFTDDVALISNTSNGNRFIGHTGYNTYKAYATSGLSTYEHDFTVYLLEEVEEIHVTGVTLNKSALSIVYGETDSSLDPTVAPAEATNKAVTWSSNNESVATVNSSGVVTAHAVGTATITVTTTDLGMTATCKVTVTPDMTRPSLVSEVFKETFANITGSLSDGFDNDGWTKSGTVARNGSSDNYSVKLAAGSAAGSITTPAITGLGTTGTLTFKAMGYDSDEKTISVSGTNCTVSPTSFADLPTIDDGYFAEKTATIKVTGDNPKITFTAASGKRVFIDDVVVSQAVTTVNVKLSATGYASYCSPFALDLTPTDDYAAWAVTGTSGATVTFTKIPGKVAANTPFILFNSDKAGETLGLPIIDDADAGIAAVAGNMLQGTLSPTYVSTVDGDYTNFGLSSGSFVKINNGVMKANKAYLPVLTSELPSDSRLTVVFNDETTGVSDVRHESFNMKDEIYTLNGQKVEKPGKGLYIMNGKKVVVK